MSRVAFISVHGCPFAKLGGKDTGGMNVYLLRVAKELTSLGVGVDIYTRSHNPHDAEVFEIGDDVRLVHIDAGRLEESKEHLFEFLPEFLGNLHHRFPRLRYFYSFAQCTTLRYTMRRDSVDATPVHIFRRKKKKSMCLLISIPRY